jgi:hypothetical protein
MADPWAFGWTQLLTMIGFAITLGIAVAGFKTFGRWKREKLEERRIEVALDALALAYESKYVFSNVRSPATFSHEYADIPKGPEETDEDVQRRAPYYAILKRIHEYQDFFERAWKLQPRCMAIFGPVAEEIFLLMHQSRREIEVSAQMLSRKGVRWGIEQAEQMEWDIWDHGDIDKERDRVGRKLEEFRLRMEALCRPIVDAAGKRIRDS